MQTLHYALADQASLDGLEILHGTILSGSVAINDAEAAGIQLGLEAGLAAGVITSDLQGGVDIRYSGTIPSEKLFGFLPISGNYQGTFHVWITDSPASPTAIVVPPGAAPVNAAPVNTPPVGLAETPVQESPSADQVAAPEEPTQAEQTGTVEAGPVEQAPTDETTVPETPQNENVSSDAPAQPGQ